MAFILMQILGNGKRQFLALSNNQELLVEIQDQLNVDFPNTVTELWEQTNG